VAEDEAGPDGILAANDVHVRAADGRQRDADDRLTCAGVRARNAFEANVIDAAEDRGAHRVGIRGGGGLFEKCEG
jgi:hypothetical protein